MADFIPKQYKKEPITIRLGFDKLESIDKLAEECGISRSEFISQCIDFAIRHMPSSFLEAHEKSSPCG